MIKIIYSDIPVGSREAFAPAFSGEDAISHIPEVMRAGVTYTDYAVTGELNQTLLDGSQPYLPDDTTEESIGIWSDALTNADGAFDAPPVFSMSAAGLYTSTGITIVTGDAYPSEVNIKWYNGETLLADADFAPDSSHFFCDKRVDSYNRVVITFRALVLPYRRLKLQGVVNGRIREFPGKELADVSVIWDCSPITAELTIDTLDFTLIGDGKIDYVFQSKQPMELYDNGDLLGVYFVDSYTRSSERFYTVSTEDYIGLLDRVQFMGGIYIGKPAGELFAEIFALANVPYTADDALSAKTVTGHLPISSGREALQQICFAIGAAIDTARADKVRIFTPSAEIVHRYAPREVMRGQTLTDRDKKLTTLRLTVHGYVPIEDTEELYNSEKDGAGDGIFVEFRSPMHSITITGGEILESNANYAIINAGAECVMIGKQYSHTETVRTKRNPLVTVSDPENPVEIKTATLISAQNADERLNALYDYYVQQGKITSEMVITGQRPGDMVEIPTEYAGKLVARLESMRFRLYGGAIVAETESH